VVDLQFFVCKRKAKIKLIFFKKSFFKFFLKKNSFGLSVMTLSTHKKTDDILCVCVYIYIYMYIYMGQMPPVGPVAWDLLLHPRVQDLSLWAVQRNIDMVQKKKKVLLGHSSEWAS